MARSKKNEPLNAPEAEIRPQLITETIEKNYMPYVMSVIVSRAIPEIDGFKPAHRKLLYTMYKMGLMTGARTKSANVVGQTMRLNPHGDAAIYETMVRLTRGHEALLHPFVDSKGSFGKQYSRDMAYAASRYTEVKLDKFCETIFDGIDKNAVEMVPNYDNTMKEPVLLPTSFPNILVSANMGIAVGMASNICSFNLGEVCDATIAILKNPKVTTEKILDLMVAPDFPGGGTIIYDREQMAKIYETGSGSIRIRSRYSYDKKQRCIDILQIPYSTSIEQIQKALTDLYKEGKLKEVSDFRDEIDLNGFKLTLDLKSGVDPDALMAKLYKLTPLESSFGCNFNVLIDGSPRQMGVVELLSEWIRFRIGCLRREFTYDLGKKKEKLHLLLGLGKILVDIDKAIRIVRETEREADVVPRLMEGFSIDELQAEYIAEIKLRHLNREYILNRLTETAQLQKEIADLEALIADDLKIKAYMVKELMEIKKKYGKPRKTQLIDASEIVVIKQEHLIENYGVKVVFTKGGYLKKITYRSLQGNSEHRLKDGDYVLSSEDAENRDEITFITNRCHLFRTKLSEFEDSKASEMGEYVAAKLGFEPDEKTVLMKVARNVDPNSNFIFIFENGKAVRIPLSAYETKSVRKKLTNAYSDASPIVAAFHEDKVKEIVLVSNESRAITIKSSLIVQKSTRTAAGATVFNLNLKRGQKIVGAYTAEDGQIADPSKYRKIKVPATGVALTPEDKSSLADKI